MLFQALDNEKLLTKRAFASGKKDPLEMAR
jgi:hypothetical protein